MVVVNHSFFLLACIRIQWVKWNIRWLLKRTNQQLGMQIILEGMTIAVNHSSPNHWCFWWVYIYINIRRSTFIYNCGSLKVNFIKSFHHKEERALKKAQFTGVCQITLKVWRKRNFEEICPFQESVCLFC